MTQKVEPLVERCEFNPVKGCGSTDPPSEDDCKNQAVWSVGKKNNWHVCGECILHEFFNKFRSKFRLSKKVKVFQDNKFVAIREVEEE